MGFSGFLKTSGTPWRMRLLVYQRFYGVLWIFENLWYTWRMRFLRAPGFYRLLWIFKNIWHTLRRWDSLCVPDFIVFAWFFVEGRISGGGRINGKNCYFCSFWSISLLWRLTKLREWRVARGFWVPESIYENLWWSDFRRAGCHGFCSFWSFRPACDGIAGHLICPCAPDILFFHWCWT